MAIRAALFDLGNTLVDYYRPDEFPDVLRHCIADSEFWRAELGRHGLLDRVDTAVFFVDTGWRKRHPAPIQRALQVLGVAASDTVFVGDDPRWDVDGARRAGISQCSWLRSPAPRPKIAW